MNSICSIKFILGMALSFLIGSSSLAQSASDRVAELKKQAEAAGFDMTERLWCVYPGGSGVGAGKHIVLISGDDEYRSEETMPMLGKILSQRYGFKCTVLFPIDPKNGTIKPDHQTNIPGMHFLDSADLVILGLRFRALPDEDMKHFVDYMNAGKPFLGTRTSTHAFNYKKGSTSKYVDFGYNSRNWKGGFGQQVLGDTWISHHGHHKVESTRGVNVATDSPILNGVTDVWGSSDVYGIRNLPDTANVLIKGQVLKGMKPESPPVEGRKNNPMMPIAWTKTFKTETGNTCRVFNTTMGAATDFENEGLRRLVVNASLWCLKMEDKIPAKANVDTIGSYTPTNFGFGTYKKGLKPRDFDLKK